jgi:uncharacterized protein YbjT (DUF2867 family)
MPSTVVVVGAGGPTGLLCIKRILEVTDFQVRAVVRSKARSEHAVRAAAGPDASTRIETFEADVTLPSTLPAAVAGAEYVLCAAGGKGFFSAEAVDNLGVGNLVDAVKAAGCCKRFVLVSGICTHPSNKYHPARVVLNTFVRWRTLEHKFAGEERVAASGLPYTIIKPPLLTNEPARQFQLHLEVDATRECPIGTGTGPYSVSRADVAAVCVAALLRPSATNKRVSVYKQRCRTVAQPLPPVPGALETELKRAFESVGL